MIKNNNNIDKKILKIHWSMCLYLVSYTQCLSSEFSLVFKVSQSCKSHSFGAHSE